MTRYFNYPVSIIYNTFQDLLQLLEGSEVEEEILDLLIMNLRIPLPSTQAVATRKEIFFPAHLVGHVMLQMLQNGYYQRVQMVMSNICKAVREITKVVYV